MNTKHSEQARAKADMVAQIEKIVAESGAFLNFNAKEWLTQWLSTPNPALNGALPNDFLDTSEGRTLVAGLISKIQSGAFA